MKKTILCLTGVSLCLSLFAETNTVKNSKVSGEDANTQFDERIINLSGYKPMYFMLGGDPVFNAKFTISLKYRFLNDDALHGKWKALNKMYVAYSQKSFWDLEDESAPFKDNNYNPEFFYLKRDVFKDRFGENVRMDFQAGYEHESNGEDGDLSRSWDRLSFIPSWVFGDPNDYHFTFAPKFWAIIAEGDEIEGDMADYYGYGELNFRYGKHDSYMLDLMLRTGMESNNEAFRLNVSYPMNKLLYKKINMYLFAQAYYGEGESMRFYNHHATSLRLGVALFR
jgi:outer membrane phospholipase A